MTAHPVTLKVSANVPKDCSFWPEDDSWNGVCEELSLTVRGSSFEDAKRKMEAALQAHIESVLRKHSRASRKKVFAGCGGFSLNFVRAGWRGLFAIERDKAAFRTFSLNFLQPDLIKFDWPDWLPQNNQSDSSITRVRRFFWWTFQTARPRTSKRLLAQFPTMSPFSHVVPSWCLQISQGPRLTRTPFGP
jgi:predicted RNase H-like HicB family nuclease